MALDSYTAQIDAQILHSHEDNITAIMPDLFRMAEVEIYRKLRIRAMETNLSVIMSTDGTADVPADYVELRHAFTLVNGKAMELEIQQPEYIYRRYPSRTSQTRPRVIARDQGSFIFGPKPDTQYTINGTYYRRLQSLLSTTTNWFTDNAPDLLFAAGMVQIFGFKESFEKASLWSQRFELISDRVQSEDKAERSRGARRRMIPDRPVR